jgi:hypothetical protein
MSENDHENTFREFLKRRKSSAGKNASATSPSPKKARRSKRQKLIQNDECPYFPANGKLFLPVELYNILSPLDGAERSPLVSHFVEKDWLPYKGQDPARCVRRFMQKALENPDKIQPHWNNRGGQFSFDTKRFEEKYKEHLAQNLGMVVALDKVKEWLKEIKEEKIIKNGGVPTEEDLEVPEQTARDYRARIVNSGATTPDDRFDDTR